MAILKNVKVIWASVAKPNTTFEPVWEVQAILNKEQVEALTLESKTLLDKGIEFSKTPTGEVVLKFKRKVSRNDGTPNAQPVCVSKDGKTPFTANIGNGSVCNIQYAMVPWKNKKGTGILCDFKGIQVLQHVPYGVQDGEEFESEESEVKDSSKQKEESFDDEDF